MSEAHINDIVTAISSTKDNVSLHPYQTYCIEYNTFIWKWIWNTTAIVITYFGDTSLVIIYVSESKKTKPKLYIYFKDTYTAQTYSHETHTWHTQIRVMPSSAKPKCVNHSTSNILGERSMRNLRSDNPCKRTFNLIYSYLTRVTHTAVFDSQSYCECSCILDTDFEIYQLVNSAWVR